MNDILYSHKSDEWGTPQDLFDKLNLIFNFTCDLAANSINYKCKHYYTKENPLVNYEEVQNKTIWCNPPYSQIKDFVKICDILTKEYGCTCVMLLPSRTDTKWFHEYIYNIYEIEFLKGRLHFNESKNSAPFPSMLVIMKP